MYGIDTMFFADAADKAALFVATGIRALFGYLVPPGYKTEKQGITRALVAVAHAGGMVVGALWEYLSPTTAAYFEDADGGSQGQSAALCWLEAGAPSGSAIFAAVDFDAQEADLPAIIAYFTAFHAAVRIDGYLVGCYGNGLVCKALKDAGLAHYTMLAGSTGWTGYTSWKPYADIVQGPNNVTVEGVSVDKLTVVSAGAGLWS